MVAQHNRHRRIQRFGILLAFFLLSYFGALIVFIIVY